MLYKLCSLHNKEKTIYFPTGYNTNKKTSWEYVLNMLCYNLMPVIVVELHFTAPS